MRKKYLSGDKEHNILYCSLHPLPGFGIGSAKILIETYSSKKILSEHPNCTLLISNNPNYDPN